MRTLICIGDSLTEGPDIPAGHTWPELMGNALNMDVVNCGIGGDTTTGMLARFYPQVIAQRPAFVLIIGGTNDLWWGQPVNAILANLFAMVVQARHHKIAAVLTLPPPVHIPLARKNDFSPPWGGYERFSEEFQQLIKAIDRYAAESELALADLHRPFVSKEGEVTAGLFLQDGLHPNKDGHQMIAHALSQTFYGDFLFRA